jgi:uncharacterized protein (TIGR03086 family)
MDPYDQLDAGLANLEVLVRGTRREQLTNATPCTEFAVRDLLAHLIGGMTVFGATFRGAPAPDLAGRDVVGDDHVESFVRARTAFDAGIRAQGALERTIDAPFGPTPAPVLLRFLAFDVLCHSWDLATATGQTFSPPAAVVEAAEEFARQAVSAEMRDGDTFADEVPAPPSATPIERLVAFAGRQP